MAEQYQVIIVGGGPAGLSAGIYATRAGVNTLVIERGVLGGQITNAELVENYPGFPIGISGFELGRLMAEQAIGFGIETVTAEVVGVKISEQDKIVKTSAGDYRAQALILASGSDHIKLDIPGGDLVGKGVSYCATCDGPLFKGKAVAVIGGGDVAIADALFLSKFATRVFVVHRRDRLRAAKTLQQKALANPKIEFIWDSVATSIAGGDRVQRLNLRRVNTEKTSSLKVAAVFVAIGLRPNTGYMEGCLSLAHDGSITVNEAMETEIPGVFAAGDIRYASIRQVVSAAGDGAVAATFAEKYLSR